MPAFRITFAAALAAVFLAPLVAADRLAAAGAAVGPQSTLAVGGLAAGDPRVLVQSRSKRKKSSRSSKRRTRATREQRNSSNSRRTRRSGSSSRPRQRAAPQAVDPFADKGY